MSRHILFLELDEIAPEMVKTQYADGRFNSHYATSSLLDEAVGGVIRKAGLLEEDESWYAFGTGGPGLFALRSPDVAIPTLAVSLSACLPQDPRFTHSNALLASGLDLQAMRRNIDSVIEAIYRSLRFLIQGEEDAVVDVVMREDWPAYRNLDFTRRCADRGMSIGPSDAMCVANDDWPAYLEAKRWSYLSIDSFIYGDGREDHCMDGDPEAVYATLEALSSKAREFSAFVFVRRTY